MFFSVMYKNHAHFYYKQLAQCTGGKTSLGAHANHQIR